MIKDLGQRFIITYYKFLARFGLRPAPVSIFEQISQANHVLLCLPNAVNGSLDQILRVNAFKEIFPKAKITLLYNSDTMTSKGWTKPYQSLQYQKDQLSTLGLPPKSLKADVLKSHFDIAIDLSLSFNFINTSIIWASKASLMIGFNHPLRDELYNFLIRIKSGETQENSYNSLFRYLGAGTIKAT